MVPLIFLILDQRGSSVGNARGSCDRSRISGLGGSGDHADNTENPSSREDISEMYVSARSDVIICRYNFISFRTYVR